MTYEINDLISCTVDTILNNNGELSYTEIGDALKCENNMTSFKQAVLFLEMSVICHNIPFYVNNERHIRELCESFKDAITFYNSNKAEAEIVEKSNTETRIDLLTGYVLPKLAFGDNTHYSFKSGSGKCKADLCDNNGVGFEVKRNYRDGSRSSLHIATAKYLIDCKNTTIEVREINPDGSVDLESYPLGRFNGVLSSKIIKPTSYMEDNLLQLIYDGTLIPEIEKRLVETGFRWNP